MEKENIGMTEKEWNEHTEKVEELHEEYPDIPMAIFDIEASEEMAEIFYDTFGY